MAEKKTPINYRSGKPLSKKNKPPCRFGVVVKVLFIVLLILFVITGGAAAAVVFNYVSETPPLDPSRLATVETSYIYDSDGEQLAALHQEQNRIVVGLEEVPEHVRQAFIAIEDERFYKHFGFDISGSLRAAYANFQAGKIVQGGSTITQQLAQNAFLSPEITYRRKVQEIWLAIQLERRYGKEEILEMYLNRVYFGNSAYGVEAAAQTYFDKSVGELTPAEGAMLAGAVHSPNRYNPHDSETEAEARMRAVLSNMKRLDFLSEAEYREALAQEFEYAEPRSPDYPHPHFIDYVIHYELIDILSDIPSIGSREEAYKAIYTGGLRVHTTMEPRMQSHVEGILARSDLYPTTFYVDLPRLKEAITDMSAGVDLSWSQMEEFLDEEGGIAQPQAAIVLADPTTGRIKALGGGRDYHKKKDEMLRFASLRSPGSAIKPVITYAPAFEEGVLAGAGTPLDDSPYSGPQGWRPQNFDLRFRGMISAREALYYSYNIPAVRAFEKLGPRVGVEYAREMGITTFTSDEIDNLSLTLGGFTHGVSAVDMAQAYGVLANEGVRVDLHTVERIEDRHGAVLFEQEVNPRQILSPQTTFIVNDILQDFVRKYLGRSLQIDRPVAAKTGTSQNWKDVYLVAYTPNLIASFWMGYDEPKIGGIQQGWRYSTSFLREVFLEAFKDLEIRDFPRPGGIIRMEVCSESGLRPTEACRAAGTINSDYFIEAHIPRRSCHLHEIIEEPEEEPEEETEEETEGPEEPENGIPDPNGDLPDNGDDPNDQPGEGEEPQEPPEENGGSDEPPEEENDTGSGGGQGDGGDDNSSPIWWNDFNNDRRSNNNDGYF